MVAPLLLSSLRRKHKPSRPRPSSSSSKDDKPIVDATGGSGESAAAVVTCATSSSSHSGPRRRQSPSSAANLENSLVTDGIQKDGVGEGVCAARDSSSSVSATTKTKVVVHLDIAPDAESPESMQVSLVDGENASPVKRGDCSYTAGGVDYLVKHRTVGGRAAVVSEEIKENVASSAGGERDDLSAGDCVADDSIVATASEGGKEKKKSKMGGLFKKGGKKGGGDGDKERQQGGSDNNDKGSGDNGSGDRNVEEKGNSNGSGNGGGGDKNDGSPFDPLAYFGPERAKFAVETTLPLHSGPESSAPKTNPSWTPVDGTEFKVRRGPNYPKNGKKEASMPCLYEVYCVRYFRSKKRTVGGATRIMPLPEMPAAGGMDGGAEKDYEGKSGETESSGDGGGDGQSEGEGGGQSRHSELAGTKIPDVLVVHFMLPYEPPNMFKQKDDGAGGECVYYLRPSKRFLDEISGRVPSTPASKLFAEWCEGCEHNAATRGRFKCMALVRDIDKHNFGLLKNYNGKPVLITESGRACAGWHGDVRYLEMTANVHYWAFMAKKGFVSLIPKFAEMQMEVGFTIEAHADHEMPECMLGSTVLSYISETTGPMISAEMQDPVHEHQA